MLEIVLFLLFICIVVFPFPKFVIRHFFDMCRYGAVDLITISSTKSIIGVLSSDVLILSAHTGIRFLVAVKPYA